MAKKAKISAAEVAFALSLLRYMGVKAPKTKPYLIVAVVTWLREKGGLSSITRKFRSRDTAARMTVALLRADGTNGPRGFGLILRAARRAAGSSAKAQQRQAADFLNAIALSAWDETHFGTTGDAKTFDESQSHLILRWQSLLGITFVIPGDQPKPVPQPKPRPKPKVQRYFANTPYRIEYIQPYAAFNFYEERHKPLPDEPGHTTEVS